MRRIVVFALLLLPFCGQAQRRQLGVLAGAKFYEGPSVSASYYFLLNNVQVGPVLEATQTTGQISGKKITYIAPGASANLLFPFSKVGFAYPGMTVRYRMGNNYSGIEYGFTAGVAYQLTNVLGLNLETGYRIFNAREGKSNPNSIISNRYTGQTVPVMIGIRLLL